MTENRDSHGSRLRASSMSRSTMPLMVWPLTARDMSQPLTSSVSRTMSMCGLEMAFLEPFGLPRGIGQVRATGVGEASKAEARDQTLFAQLVPRPHRHLDAGGGLHPLPLLRRFCRLLASRGRSHDLGVPDPEQGGDLLTHATSLP